jgi:ATP-binding cassette subfamily C (CFTR/MRP) protein 1
MLHSPSADGKGKILVLDEATSNVDAETDREMQRIVRDEFQEFTVVCVAHRLETIEDADKVLVLDGGRAVEFGAPLELARQEGSAFRKLKEGLSNGTREGTEVNDLHMQI